MDLTMLMKKEWVIECEVSGKWVELMCKPTEEEANKVVDFMLLARCGGVRTIVRTKSESDREVGREAKEV